MSRLVWALLAVFAASTVSAQSLVEIAQKEKARRKKVQSSGDHSYTESDLKNVEGPMTQVSGTSTRSAQEGSGSEEAGAAEGESANADADAPEDPTRTEAYWRGRLSTIDKRIQDLQTKLSSPAMTSNPRGATEREAAEKQLAQARADRQAVVNEARAAGAPPGWVR